MHKVMSLNSTLVQFKHIYSHPAISGITVMSQFHFGSIQTHPAIQGITVINFKSQFHFGSIQTILVVDTMIILVVPGLNSTLVQFKRL